MADLLTVKAAAKQIDTSPMTIYRLVYAGQLKYVTVGLGKSRPRIRIDAADLARFKKEGVR